MVLDGKFPQEYTFNAASNPYAFIFHYKFPTIHSCYDIIPDHVICNIAVYADNLTLNSACDGAIVLWKELELPSEL